MSWAAIRAECDFARYRLPDGPAFEIL